MSIQHEETGTHHTPLIQPLNLTFLSVFHLSDAADYHSGWPKPETWAAESPLLSLIPDSVVNKQSILLLAHVLLLPSPLPSGSCLQTGPLSFLSHFRLVFNGSSEKQIPNQNFGACGLFGKLMREGLWGELENEMWEVRGDIKKCVLMSGSLLGTTGAQSTGTPERNF